MADAGFAIKRQLDAICNQFEEQWAVEIVSDFERFLSQVDGSHRNQLLKQLLQVDVELRSKAGHAVEPGQYELLGDEAIAIVRRLLKENPTTRSSVARQEQAIDQTRNVETGADSSETLVPVGDHKNPDPPKNSDTPPQKIGRYRVDSVLGKGGFGLVYLAFDDQLDRHVAIKVPHARLVSRPQDAQVYLTEARTVANLDHPNIVPVYDVGQTDDFPCYVVSKYIEGTDLSDRIKNER